MHEHEVGGGRNETLLLNLEVISDLAPTKNNIHI